MGFTGAHVLHKSDVFILALYLLSHVCALLEYTFQPKNIANIVIIEDMMDFGHWTEASSSYK